jgi:hypothetical protein
VPDELANHNKNRSLPCDRHVRVRGR